MVIKDGAKMSKSKGNVVDPDDLIRTFGADTARLFSLFAAPPEKDLDWNDHGVEGASRFLNRVWRFVETHHEELTSVPSAFEVGGGETPPPPPPPAHAGATARSSNSDAARGAVAVTTEEGRAFRRTIHETLKRVTDDIEGDFHFNTAVSAIMELVNALYAFEAAPRDRVPPAERAALLREATEATLLLLGPFCPHVSEEMWQRFGHTARVCLQAL